jgi:biotin transporter BioY
MVRILGVWVLVSFVIGFLIVAWQVATGKERWQLTKTVAFAILCGLIASMFMGFVYILF